MTVTVALPKNLVAAVEITPQVARISHVLVVSLFYQSAHIAVQVHLQYAIALVSALVEFEC